MEDLTEQKTDGELPAYQVIFGITLMNRYCIMDKDIFKNNYFL